MQALMNQVLDNAWYQQEGLVRTTIEKTFDSSFEKEIVSPRLVRIRGRESKIAELRREATNKTIAKQAREIFDKRYTPVTQIYKLQKLSPSAGEQLVKNELNTYSLHGTAESRANVMGPWENIDLPGGFQVRPSRAGVTETADPVAITHESVFADESARALVVKAIPAKQERIAQMLAQMDDMIQQGTPVGAAPKAARQYRIELVLLQGGKAGESVDASTSGPRRTLTPEERQDLRLGITSIEAPVKYDPAIPQKYGITKEDLKLFGFDAAVELGRSLVTVIGEPGELGKSSTRLTPDYVGELSFRDVRDPYVVLQVMLSAAGTDGGLIENNVFLEPGKPAVLGVTNLKQALILILRLHE